MPYLVNSSPGAGLRSEPSAQFENAVDALLWAAGLGKRGMRMVRIFDIENGKIYEEAALRDALKSAP